MKRNDTLTDFFSPQILLWLLLFFCLLIAAALTASAETVSRTLSVQQSVAARGQNKTIIIEMEAVGNENAVGFSLNFDPKQLRYVMSATGNGVFNAALNINTNSLASGRLGLAMALPGGQKIAAGKQQVAVVTFTVLAADNVTNTTLSFGDQPIPREVVDVTANAVAANFSSGTLTFAQSMAIVSAASFNNSALSVESIAATFGSKLATETKIATTLPLPNSLGGTNVVVRDSAGIEHSAPLFFVSPTQLNFLVPAGTASGPAIITATGSDGSLSVANVDIATVAPALFSAASDGSGVAVAIVQRVKANGATSYEPIATYDLAQNKFVALPIDLGPDLGAATDQVFLVLFGTGLRYRSSLSNVSAKLGGIDAQVLFAGATQDFVGLDQINLRLPRSLAGRGYVNITLTVDGKTANTVMASIK